LLFLSLLVYVSLRSVGAWRQLRSLERGENVLEEVKEQARVHRTTLAMVTASIAAFIVQAVFNVQQVGLSFSFWLLVGCSTVIAQAVRVRETVTYAYQNGGASLMDFLNAQSDYRNVQMAYLQLIGAYLTATGQLNLAVGREVIQ